MRSFLRHPFVYLDAIYYTQQTGRVLAFDRIYDLRLRSRNEYEQRLAADQWPNK